MWIRMLVAAAALALTAAACSGRAATPDRSSPTAVPVGLPDGTPSSYAREVDAGQLSAEALVPAGTTPSDLWPAIAPDGTQFALVAFAAPGNDPFRRARGLIVWRRFDAAPPWRPVFGISDGAEAGVVEVQATIGDVTADGSPDALTFEGTGGSGACGTWRVLDLAANAQVFKKNACDTTIDLSTDPVGLVLRAAVYREGDAHCCPSAIRTTVLTYQGGGGWAIASPPVSSGT